MALFLSATMSFAMVVIHLGFVDNFFTLWLGDMIIGFVVAYPVSLIALPVTIKAASVILKTEPPAE